MDELRPPIQRIERLTPLAEVLACVDADVRPVPARELPVAQATGRILADEVRAGPHPRQALALRDGVAVRSEETNDAGSYAPAPLSSAARVQLGDLLPSGTDAVALLDAVDDCTQPPQALAPVSPGEGVLAAGQDVGTDTPLLSSGRPLHSVDLAILAALGIERVPVRLPTIRLSAVRADPVARAVAALLTNLIAPQAIVDEYKAKDAQTLDARGADALVIVGGSGSGERDDSVRALARAGRVYAHGIGLSPGETSAFGFIGSTPVLIVPGRLDAALSVWHIVGARILARLAARADVATTREAKLVRKIASTVGLVEFVPVRADGDALIPLATGYLPWRALTHATGYVLVPAQSEGFAAGAVVTVTPL
jgi:molybdopterin biosynthesis enzyme